MFRSIWLASHAPPRWNRTEVLILAALVGGGLLLRIACAAFLPSPLETDYLAYWTIANNLYAGHGLLGVDGQPTAFFSLGYPIFLAGVFVVLGPTVAAVKAANILLGAIAICLVYVAARRLFASAMIAAFSAAALAIHLELIVYASYVAKENLMIVLVLAQFGLAASKRRTLLNSALFGLATGTLAIVGNAALALMPALVLQFVFSGKSLVRTGADLIIAASAACLVMAPLIWRNHQEFGGYSLNNNGGFNLYIGNNPNATPFFESISETPIGDRWHEMLARLGERGADLKLGNLAIEHIHSHPAATLELAVRKAAAFWWPSFHGGRDPEGQAAHFIRLLSVLQFIALSALFAATLTVRRFARPLLVLWVMVAGYTALHMIFYVIYRYRLPIVPVLCIGAGVSAQALLARARISHVAEPARSLTSQATEPGAG